MNGKNFNYREIIVDIGELLVLIGFEMVRFDCFKGPFDGVRELRENGEKI